MQLVEKLVYFIYFGTTSTCFFLHKAHLFTLKTKAHSLKSPKCNVIGAFTVCK